MPYLNWKERSPGLRQEVEQIAPERPDTRLRMTLALDAEEIGQLAPMLAEVLGSDAAGELRLDLRANWIVFFKRREGESRLLIAHPQTEEWVATAALSADHGASFAQRLATLGPGQSLRLGEIGRVDRVSNLELVIARV